MIDDLLAIVGHRVTLGLCAMVLALGSLRGWFDTTATITAQSGEQECRARILGAAVAEIGLALERIEGSARAQSRGDEAGMARAVALTDGQIAAYHDAVDDQANAVTICRGA